MKNKINSLALLIVLSSLGFTSCDNNDDATGESTLIVNSGVTGAVASVTAGLSLTAVNNVNEFDENTYVYSVTLSKAQPVDVHVAVRQIAGTATEDADFEMDHTVVIPAYSTSATGSIKFLNDVYKEAEETLTIQIGDVSTSNASLAAKTISFSINNYVSTKLDLAFAFNHEFGIGFNNPYFSVGTIYNLCGVGYDMDFYLLDSSFADTGNYGAATGACVEKLSLNGATLANGTYYIVYDIYDDANLAATYHDAFDIPVTVTYGKAGAIDPATFLQEEAFVATSTDGTGSDFVISFELLNGVFKVVDSNANVLATGRQNNVLKNAIAKAKANRNK
jgi:hypothetical protein